ncbi:MAG TPA: hypothetical protein VF719_13600 [Abditibacteriaceae bacterium]|jgi:hypothetical protein
MRKIDVSDILGIWFHDVKVNRINIDYVKREVKLDFVLPIGFWNTPNREGLTEGEKKGTLVFTGLLYLVLEPPDANYNYDHGMGIEITDEGSATRDKFESCLSNMPQDLPEDAFLHYFYVCEWNSFIFVAATGAHFL